MRRRPYVSVACGVLMAGLGLAGCSSADSTVDHPEQVATGNVTSDPGASASASPLSSVPANEAGRYSSWTPAHPIARPTLTMQEKMALRARDLKGHQALEYGDVPRVQLIRFTSQYEWAPTIVKCMRDLGWNDTVTEDGLGVKAPGNGIDEAQQPAYFLADYKCNAAYSIDPTYQAPMNKAQKSVYFDFYKEVMVPCLAAHGYRFEPLPSRSVFIATFPGDKGWYAYAKVDDHTRAQADCPELNPANLWG